MKSNKSKKSKKFKYVNYSRIGTYLFALFIEIYVFFGLICGYYGENPVDNSILYFYQIGFRIYYGLPFLIIFGISFLVTYRDEITLVGVKLALSFIPIIFINAIIWYWINIDFGWTPFILLFGRIQGYISMVLTSIIVILASYVGYKIKQYQYIRRNLIYLENTN